MPDLRQALRDFVATSNSGKYADEATLLSKFPELQGYDINVLKDFVATSNSGKYATEDELFSKFPEFNLSSQPPTEVKKKEDTTVLPSGVGSSVSSVSAPDETDYFQGTFGNILRKFDEVSPIGIGDFADDMARAVASGYRQGDVAQAANKLLLSGTTPSMEEIQNLIDKQEKLQQIGSSKEFQDYQKTYDEEGKGVWGFIKGISQNPSILPEVMASSMTSMATNRDAVLAALGALGTGATIGASTAGTAGATVGSVVPVAGTAAGGAGGAVAGAISGAVSSIPYAFGLASTIVETGSTFSELLQEELGDKDLTKENVKAILEDPEKYNDIRNKAIARGVAIGVIDTFTGKLASGVGAKILAKSAAKSATGAATKGAVVGATAAGAGIESGGGSFGEAAARGLIGQEMDTGEILLEGIAEMPGGIRSTLTAMLRKPTYKVGGQNVSAQEIDNLIETMTPEQLVAAKIEIDNDFEGRDVKLQDKIVTGAIRNEIKSAQPDLNEPTVNAIVELQKELNKLEGNKTQVAKDKAAQIRADIKNLQENPLPEPIAPVAKPSYKVNGEEVSADVIDNLLETKSKEELLALNIQISNDTEGRVDKFQEIIQPIKPQEYAVQEQAAGQVPVQPTTTISEEVAQGEPQAEPQVTAEAGVQEEVKPQITETKYTKEKLPELNKELQKLFKKQNRLQKQFEKTEDPLVEAELDKTNEELTFLSTKIEELESTISPAVSPVAPTAPETTTAVSPEPQEEVVSSKTPAQTAEPITITDIKVSFAPENAIEIKKETVEDARGRKFSYDASVTSQATDQNGTPIGIITKRSDADGKLSFTLKNTSGQNINKGKAYPTERDARVALAEQVNRIRAKAAPVVAPAPVNKKASEVLANYEKGTEINLSELETVQPPSDSVVKTIFDEFKKAFNNITIVGKRATEGAAFYDTVKKRIELNKNSTHWNQVSSESLISNLAHEFVHERIDNSENKKQIESDLEKIKKDLIAKPPTFANENDKSIFSFIVSKNNSPQEVLTYMVSNPELRKYLVKHEAKLNEISQQLFGIDVIQPQQIKQYEQVQSKRRGDRGVSDTGREIAPLKGAPIIQGATGPDANLVAVAEQYAADNGIDLKRQAEYVEVDEERAKRIADAYDKMANDPSNPKVKEAYKDLIRQTRAQYDALKKAGYEFTFFDDKTDPYNGNPNNAMRDLRQNKKMAVYGTFAGYGTEGITDSQVENNPLLVDTGLRWKDQNGKEQIVTANDLFRAVHDAFGHGLEGSGFRARGEENAWQAHVRLFTGPAVAALTSETRGQNSWLNFGPFGEKNRTAKVEDTVFAEQKIGIMPEWTWTEGRAADMEAEPSVAETEAVEKVEGKLDELLTLDPEDKGTLKKISEGLDGLINDIDKLGRETLGVNIALPVMKAILKSVKALVDTGITLQEAIKRVAKQNNTTPRNIINGINAITQIAPIQKEYDALMEKVDSLITKQKAKDIDTSEIASNAEAMVRDEDTYINANDTQKKIIEGQIRAKLGMEPRKAASIGRVLGAIQDITNISRKEKLTLISRIRELSKDTAKDLIAEIRELEKAGKISSTKVTNILSRFSKINFLNESSVSSFVDYITKVFSEAKYDENISKAQSQLSKAKKNIRTKIGVAQDLFVPLDRLLSINPTLIPLNQLEKYLGIVKEFSERKTVLTIRDRVQALKDVNEILAEIDNEQSSVDVLADRLNNYEKQVLEDGKLNYSATIKKMVNEGLLTTDDAELMSKYKSDILPQVEPSPLTDEQIEEQKKVQIGLLKQSEIKDSGLPTRDERKDAIDLRKLIKELSVTDLMNLPLVDLKNMLKVINNINNNYLPNYAKISIEKLQAIKNAKLLAPSIEKAKPLPFSTLYNRLKTAFPKVKENAIEALIKSNPLFYIDNVFGDFKTKNIFNSLLEKSAEALSSFKSELKKVDQKLNKAQDNLLASLKYDPDKFIMSKFRMTAYMLQREYESNIGKKGVRPVTDYLEATIKHIRDGKSVFNEMDAVKLEKVLDEVKQYTVDGKFDLDKFYKTFSPAEKNAINVVTEINESLGEKASYTSSVLRGDRAELMDNYFHHNVLHEQNPTDVTSAPEFSSSYSESMRPSTKAKSLIERTGDKTPLNFDLFASAHKGAKFVLLDYNLTSPVRTARRTLIQTKKMLEDKGLMNKDRRKIFNAIDGAYEEALSNLLTNNIIQDSFGDEVINFIQKQGYRAALAGTSRFVAELSSNINAALWLNPKAFTQGTKYMDLIMSAEGFEFMKNVGSKQTSKLYASDALSGRLIDPSILKESVGIKGEVSKGKLVSKTQQIYNLTLKKIIQNPVEMIADTLITTPDKIVSLPLWFGNFANEFKKITGEDFNREKIVNNDVDYMKKYEDAIQEAKRKADSESVAIGAANNEFMGVLKGRVKPNQSVLTRAFNNFNTFLTNFMNFDYSAARAAVYNLWSEGYMPRKKAAALLAAITTRSIIYQVMVANMGAGLVGAALGVAFDLEDEEEIDERTFFDKLKRGIATVLVGYTLGRNFGNVTRGMINYGVEKINQEYLDFMRSGEYDFYKDNIAYTYLPAEEKNRNIDIAKTALAMAGPYTSAFNTVDLIARNLERILSGETTKKDLAAIEREDMTVNYRIPLEVAGNLGLIPFYKDVRKAVNDHIYSSIKQAEIMSKITKQEEEDLLGGYENKTDLKRYDRALYEKNFGEGSEYYEAQKEEKEEKKKLREEKQKEKDIEYGYQEKGFGSRKKQESNRWGSTSKKKSKWD